MKMNAKIPTENIARHTRARESSMRRRPTGRPMKIVRPAIAPRPMVWANGSAEEEASGINMLGSAVRYP